MRYALAALLLATPALSAEAPTRMQGLWTTTANGCDALLQRQAVDKADSWLKIEGGTVSGSSKGRVLRAQGAQSFESTGSGVEGVPMVYALRSTDLLSETVGDARASLLFQRCR